MAAPKKVAVDIVATDEASEKLDHVADRVEQLDGKSVVIGIDAEGEEQVAATLTDVVGMVEKLSAEDAQIVLAINAAGVQQELTDVLLDIAKATGTPAEIEIKIAKANELRKQFDQITGAIKEIEGRKLTIDTADFEGDMDRALQNVQEFTDKVRQAGDEAVDITVSTKVDDTDLKETQASLRLISDRYKEIASSLRSIQERKGDLVHEDDIADAERLSAALQEAADAGEHLGQGAGTAGVGVEDLTNKTKTLDSASSVLANTVGNTAQDLGQMGGVAGTAGVAIGQMAEYMVDASNKGMSMAQVFRGFAGVVGPVAALSVALFAVNEIMDEMAKGQAATKAFDTDQIEQFTDAINEGGDAVQNYNASLEETGEVLADTGVKAGPAWTQIIPGVDVITRGLGFLGKFGHEIENILPLLNQAGVSSEIWTNVVTAGAGEQEAKIQNLRAALLQTNITEEERMEIITGARNAQENYTDSVENAAEVNKFFTDTIKAREVATKNMGYALSLQNRSQRLVNEAIEAAINDTGHADDVMQENIDTKREDLEASLALAEGISGISAELRDMADAQGELRAGALADILDVGDDAIDTLSSIQDINQGMRDFASFLREPQEEANKLTQDLADANQKLVELQDTGADGLKVVDQNAVAAQKRAIRDIERELADARSQIGTPDIFDPDDVRADDFLAKIRSLKGPIQEQVSQAFGDQGAASAQAMGARFVESLAQQTGLSPENIRTLLGLDNLMVKLNFAVEQTEIDKAKNQLTLLRELLGLKPGGATDEEISFIARTSIALDEKSIDPANAQAKIQERLRSITEQGRGVEIPSTLAVPDTDQFLADTQRDLDNGQPLQIPVGVGDLTRVTSRTEGVRPSVVYNTYNSVLGAPPVIVDGVNRYVDLNGQRG